LKKAGPVVRILKRESVGGKGKAGAGTARKELRELEFGGRAEENRFDKCRGPALKTSQKPEWTGRGTQKKTKYPHKPDKERFRVPNKR